MAEPFLSEIRMMSFIFPPQGWALCNGQLLPINQNQALFALLGTNFGGNGQTNFALPDLRNRVPIHVGAGFSLGQNGGEAAHTLTTSELPQHAHVLSGTSNNGTALVPSGNLLAATTNFLYHSPDNGLTALSPGAVSSVGGSQAHTNQQPSLTISFCIALQGLFPSPT